MSMIFIDMQKILFTHTVFAHVTDQNNFLTTGVVYM